MTSRQSFNLACCLQLDRIKAHLAQQTIRQATPVCVVPSKRRFVVGPGIWASAAKRKKPQSLSSVSAKSSVAERSAIEEWNDPARTAVQARAARLDAHRQLQIDLFTDRVWES